MKRVLVIAYNFPPIGGAGVQRTLKFVKYLGDFAYLPTVFSVNPHCVRKAKDHTLTAEIPPGIRVLRAPTIDPDYLYKALYGLKAFHAVEWLDRRVFVPDIQTVWNRFALPRLDRLASQEKFDLVYVSGAPFSSFQLGEQLKRRYGLPLVLDFRDEWTTNPVVRRSIPLTNRERLLERQALHTADGLVLLSRQMREHLLSVYPEIADLPCEIIPNGYDEEDFGGLTPRLRAEQDPMRIVFTGTLYGRFIDTFRQAVQGIDLAMRSGSIPANSLILNVYGNNLPHVVLPQAPSFVHFGGHLPHRESIRRLLEADCLLLPVGSDPQLSSHYSGKLFEYLRAGHPILGIVPPHGEAADVLRSTHSGIIPDDDSPEMLAQAFIQAYSICKEHRIRFEPDMPSVVRYERRALTGHLAALFDRLSERSHQ